MQDDVALFFLKSYMFLNFILTFSGVASAGERRRPAPPM